MPQLPASWVTWAPEIRPPTTQLRSEMGLSCQAASRPSAMAVDQPAPLRIQAEYHNG
jgi:hypothetical protein